MQLNFLDTSAVLNGALEEYAVNCYISTITLSELENIKTSTSKNQKIKYEARKAIHNIIHHYLNFPSFSVKEINKILKSYNFLTDINDHKILCEAALIGKRYGFIVNFITSDYAQFLFAKRIKYLKPIYYEREEESNEDYCGWGKYYPTNQQFNLLYSDPKMNILKCEINEFAQIFQGSELKDVLFWNGQQYRKLKYKEIKNPYLNTTIKPRNLQQKMAFDLLQNKDIKVKLLTSAWGGGKTLLALSYALEQVNHGNFRKLVFVRNNIIVADTNDIGYLPGKVNEKMSIWGAPLADHLGDQQMLNQLIDQGIIEIYPLSHIRGRSIKDSIVICDQCENMNDKLVTLLMSRIQEGSQLIFCGDIAQIDNKRFEQNNGIRSMIKHLTGQPLFGTVKLIKSERGAVGRMCDLMRPPV